MVVFLGPRSLYGNVDGIGYLPPAKWIGPMFRLANKPERRKSKSTISRIRDEEARQKTTEASHQKPLNKPARESDKRKYHIKRASHTPHPTLPVGGSGLGTRGATTTSLKVRNTDVILFTGGYWNL